MLWGTLDRAPGMAVGPKTNVFDLITHSLASVNLQTPRLQVARSMVPAVK